MASNKTEIKFNTKKLDSLLTYLKSLDDYYVKVGIIGSKAKAQHKNTELTNAELGAIHEFGKGYQPQRSFLEIPLKMKFNKDEQAFKEIKKKAFMLLFKKRNPKEFFTMLGSKALDIVNGAFETNGYNTWTSWSEAYEKRRKIDISKSKRRELNKSYYDKYGQKGFFSLKDVQNMWVNRVSGLRLNLTGQLKGSIAFKVMKKK